MRAWWAAILLAIAAPGCRGAPTRTAPRWMIARHPLTALDDASTSLRRGFGVEIVEERGDRGRSGEGHWFALAELEPARPLTEAAPAPLPAHVERPPEVGPIERWIDVDLATQRLTALEGDRPVRAMKISSGVGADGAAYSTPRGSFRIYAKLRRATMASPAPSDPARGGPPDPHPYRFEGVPDVEYFYKEIALHGAYWHRRFGERVSHGCVNLAPVDAAWLFAYTAPALGADETQRAAPPGKPGTLVRVR